MESPLSNHPGATRHPSLAKEGRFYNRHRSAISAVGQQIAGLTAAVYSGKSEVDGFRRRLERIERRLELADPPH